MLRSDDDRARGANAALGHITKLDHTVVRIDGVHLRKGSMVIRRIRGDPGTPYATLGANSVKPSVVVPLMQAFSERCGCADVAPFRAGRSLPGLNSSRGSGRIRGHHTQLSVPSLGEPSVVVSLMPAFSGGCGSTEVAHFRSGGSLPGSTRLGVSGRVGMSCVWCPRIHRIHLGASWHELRMVSPNPESTRAGRPH